MIERKIINFFPVDNWFAEYSVCNDETNEFRRIIGWALVDEYNEDTGKYEKRLCGMEGYEWTSFCEDTSNFVGYQPKEYAKLKV